jgi:hypothetical protein
MDDLGIDDHKRSTHAIAIHTAGHVNLAARTCAPHEFLISELFFVEEAKDVPAVSTKT